MGNARGYDLLTPFYDVMTSIVFGGSLHKAQIHYLRDIPAHAKVLVLGGGTGQWLKQASLRNREPNITYIDLSPSMITRARRNGEGMNVVFIEGTQELLHGGEDFEVVVLFCYLDLFDNHSLSRVVSKIIKSMKPGARWLVVDFVNRKWWHAVLLFFMYVFFRIATGLKTMQLPEWQAILEKRGIREDKHREFYGHFIRSSSRVGSL
jgi:tRNA (cmo5U34)-methyltransferase